MTNKSHTALTAILTTVATCAAANAGVILNPPAANPVSVPSKSIGAITPQEPVMFTSFGMFGTLTDDRAITQQVLITTEDTASMTGGIQGTSIALFNSFGDLLAVGAPDQSGSHSVIDFALAAGEFYVAVTSPGAVFADGFNVAPILSLLPETNSSYSLRIMTIPSPAAIVVVSVGLGVTALRRRGRDRDTK